MSKPIRYLCLFLALLMVSSVFVACGKTEETGDETDNAATNATVTEQETDPVEDALTALRSEVDWGGKDFGILYVNEFGYTEEVEAEQSVTDESSSGVINDAVFERNTLFEEYCNLSFVLIPVPNSAVSGRIQGEVQTGTGDFQLITTTTDTAANNATAGYLYNYLDLDETIDYEQVWWDAGTLEFALDGRVFFMDGPFNIVDDDVTFVLMFNKELREQYKIANPYDTVRAGDWTLSYFNSIISQLATDNGDGKWDEKDTYGFSTPGSIGNTFFYGAGLQYVVNNREMDAPELVLAEKMEQALDVLAIARSIVHDNNSTYVAPHGSEAISKEVFIDGRSLFYCEAASYLRGLNATMEREYGVIPVPKYNKEQEHYTTWRHSIGSTLSIPTTVARNEAALEQFALVLETYTVLSQKLVRPAYYEIMLTTRNVQDVESSDMLDLIFQHRTYDMAMYFTALSLGNLFEDAVKSAGDNFSSKYASASKGFDKKVANILRKLQNPR
ncbi:MAG: hypothetical protein IJA91_06705 [Clostridia bacterium]|nr:hypothetical protein [Clostridia bacterium]